MYQFEYEMEEHHLGYRSIAKISRTVVIKQQQTVFTKGSKKLRNATVKKNQIVIIKILRANSQIIYLLSR